MKAWQKSMVLIAATGCVLVTFRSSDAVTNYVAQNGQTPGSPYTSWATAASNIQAAVSAAVAGNTVMVSNGTYVLSARVTIGNVILKSLNGRDATIVDGGNYVGRATTNACFLMNDDSAVIDGFTISNGYVNAAAGYPDNCGGGVRLSHGTLRNCVIDRCTAVSFGGGVYCDTVATVLLISNCVFSANNIGSQGGGVCNAISVPLTIVDCVISNNTAPNNSGGGMLLQSGGVMRNCTVTANRAAYGGGIHLNGGMVSNCVISANTSTDANNGGGGVRMDTQGSIWNSTIVSNRSNHTGGGLLVLSSGIGGTIRNCTISGNSVHLWGGGVSLANNGNVVNCLISSNVTDNDATYGFGGGIFADNIGNGTISSCTIVSNTARRGGGLAFNTGANNNSVSNCVIYANANIGGAFPADSDIYANTAANSNAFAFCCSSYANFPPGRGNISADPLFVDAVGGNYRLRANSPCYNVGSLQPWMTNGVDLDGKIRIRYGIVDIGCYEFLHSGAILSLQ